MRTSSPTIKSHATILIFFLFAYISASCSFCLKIRNTGHPSAVSNQSMQPNFSFIQSLFHDTQFTDCFQMQIFPISPCPPLVFFINIQIMAAQMSIGVGKIQPLLLVCILDHARQIGSGSLLQFLGRKINAVLLYDVSAKGQLTADTGVCRRIFIRDFDIFQMDLPAVHVHIHHANSTTAQSSSPLTSVCMR